MSATASPSPPDEQLRETTAALTARIDGLEGRLEAAASPELEELRGSIDEIRNAVQALEGRIEAVGAAPSAPDNELVETTVALTARIAELEARLEAVPSPDLDVVHGSIDEVRNAVKELEGRIEEVGAAPSAPNDELVEMTAALTARIAELEGRVEAAPSPDLGGIQGSIDEVRESLRELHERVEAVSAAPSAPDNELVETTVALTARIAELEGRLEAVPSPDLGGIHGSIDEVRNAVKALEGRIEEVGAAPNDELVEMTAALTARITELEGRIETAASPELEELRGSLGELRARLDGPNPTVVELERRLETTVDGLLERIETLNQASADDAVLGGLRDSVAGLQQQAADLAARDEVDAIRVALGAVSEQVKELAGRSGGVTHEDLDRQLGLALGDLRERVDAATVRHDDDAISELRGAFAALEAQLGALREQGSASASDAALDEVRARLDGLTEQIDRAQQEADAHLGEVVGAEQAERLALANSVGEALGRLDDLDELRARVEALAKPSDVVHDALRPVEDRLAALADHVNEIREVALARPASSGAEDTERLTAAVADLSARLREVASRPTGVSQDQLERRLADVVVALEAQSSSNAVTTEVADEVASIQQAVAGLEARFAGVAGSEAVAGIQSTVAHIGSRVDDLSTTLAEATKSLERRDGPSKDELDALVATERAAREELAARVKELAAVPLMDEHARAELAELRERVSGLADRPDQSGELDELRQRVSELAALPSQASDVAELRRKVSELAERPDDGGALDELRQRIAELAERPDQSGALAELRERVSQLAERTSQGDEVAELRQEIAALAELPHRLGAVDELQRKVSELAARPTQEAAVDELRHRVAELAEQVGNEDALTALEQALVQRHEAEAAARSSLESQLGELRNDLHGLAELRARLDALASEQHDNVRQGDLEALRHHLGAVDGRLDGLASTDWVASLEQAARDASHAVNERLEGLELRLVDADRTTDIEQLHALVGDLNSRLGAVDSGLSELGKGIDATVGKALRKGLEHTVAPEALAQLAADLYARLAAVEAAGPTTRDALDELGMRLGATEQQAWALPEQLDDRFGRLHLELSSRIEGLSAAYDPAVAALHARLDELAAVQAAELERLAGIEHAAASANVRLEGLEARHAHDGTVSDQITVLTTRLDNELELAEERSKAVERAIRKGLASLGERLTAKEEAYLESGAAFRRSLERLGAAVVEADTRLADMPLDPPANGYVAFVPTPDGYRLRPLDGAAPDVGEIIEVESASGPLRVARIARSPLPLDRRACAYLEHV